MMVIIHVWVIVMMAMIQVSMLLQIFPLGNGFIREPKGG